MKERYAPVERVIAESSNIGTFQLALLLGRYLPLVLPLMVAGWLASKRVSPVSNSTLRLESVTFGVTLIAVILILNFLSFLPSAVLGPIGEGLELSTTVSRPE